MKNDQLLRDLGRVYATQASDFLREKFGSQMELRELGIFYSSASSWMVAKAFAIIFEKASPDEAQAFLQQVLSGLSAGIRLQKIPVMVKIEATMNLTAKAPEPEVEAPAPPAPAEAESEPEPEAPQGCSCKLLKGECKVCPDNVTAGYRDLAAYLLAYMKDLAAKTKGLAKDCPSCLVRYSDLALAQIAKDGIPEFKGEPQELNDQVLQALVQVAGAFGVTKLTETSRVIQERSR